MELRLASSQGARARYSVSLFDPSAEWTSGVEVGSERDLGFDGWSGPSTPPAWLEALAKTLLRGTVRQQQTQGSWPRRLTRWRPGPGAEE